MSISPQISCGKSSDYEISVKDLVSGSICLHGTSCNIAADVTRCGNRKRRQTSEEQSEITFTFTFDFDNETDAGKYSILINLIFVSLNFNTIEMDA